MLNRSRLCTMILTITLCLPLVLALADDAVGGDARIVPTPPEYRLPPPTTEELIVVANALEYREELSKQGYWVAPSIGRALLAAEDGYTIYVTAGVYFENIEIYDMQDTQLIGEEGVTVVAQADDHVCFLQNCADIRIHNIDVVHEIGESPCLHNCFVIWDCQDLLIEFCDISGSGYIGVEVLGNGAPENIRVENCAIHDCEVAFYDAFGGVLKSINNVIWDCKQKTW